MAGAGVSDVEASDRELDAGLKIDLGSGVIGDSGAGFFADTSIKGSLKANLMSISRQIFSVPPVWRFSADGLLRDRRRAGHFRLRRGGGLFCAGCRRVPFWFQ